MTYSIQTLNNISDKGISLLPPSKYLVSDEAESPDAILLRSFKMHEMEIPESLKAVGRAGAGVNNIPLDKMSDAGVVVFNAPGANSNAVKELVIAGMLMACRNLVLARDFAINLEGEDEVITKQVEAGKKNFGGFELPGRILGVVGLGAIGVLVANAAVSLGMRVIGFDPLISVDKAWELDANVEKASDINHLLKESDFITFHVPLVESTKDLINDNSLHNMKDNVVILNFARNGIVNDKAVCKALDTGKVYSYVCDFPSTLLNNHKRVIALPHLGASTGEAEENCAIMVANEVRNYLENGTILNSVNMPTINLPRAGDSRISMIHENIPDMVGQVSHILGKVGANIIHMVNNSRDNVAVTLLDVEANISEETQSELSNIAGMLKLRII
ncbi:MAG: 3-phosphoglycerate dehydrogenase family protein [Cocleimonas sp.]|nr:3-phosphoglycerate dehydrogenase family protein [Cocleimonas sp.]